MEKIKVVFFGNPEFGVNILETLERYNDCSEIVGIVTDQPKVITMRGHKKEQSSPIYDYSKVNLSSIPILHMESPDFSGQLKALNPDLGIVIGFKYLPKEIYEIPFYGCYNVHTSLLPKYRGAAPVEWAVINGESETGVTIFKIQDKIDTGNIYFQESFPIVPSMTVPEIKDLMKEQAIQGLWSLIQDIYKGTPVSLKPQEEIENPPVAPKIRRDNSKIIWKKPLSEVSNQLRGLSPKGWTEDQDGGIYKILSGEPTSIECTEPGRVEFWGDDVIVGTCDYYLKITKIQPAGKLALGPKEFINGYKNKITKFKC